MVEDDLSDVSPDTSNARDTRGELYRRVVASLQKAGLLFRKQRLEEEW